MEAQRSSSILLILGTFLACISLVHSLSTIESASIRFHQSERNSSTNSVPFVALINQYDNCHAYVDPIANPLLPPVVVFWTVREANNEIDLGLTCDGYGQELAWCAIGWKLAVPTIGYPTMLNADINLAAIATGRVADWSNGAHYPPRNATSASALCLADQTGLCPDSVLPVPSSSAITNDNATAVRFTPGATLTESPGVRGFLSCSCSLPPSHWLLHFTSLPTANGSMDAPTTEFGSPRL